MKEIVNKRNEKRQHGRFYEIRRIVSRQKATVLIQKKLRGKQHKKASEKRSAKGYKMR